MKYTTQVEKDFENRMRKLGTLKKNFIKKYKEIYEEEGFDNACFGEFLKEVLKEGLNNGKSKRL